MSQTTPSGAEILSVLRQDAEDAKAIREIVEHGAEVRAASRKSTKAIASVAALLARNAELEAENKALRAELATLDEEWFMCCHPAWPDPLPCWGGKADAIDTINRYHHPDAWLLRTLRGGRIEYKGADLEALARTPANGDAA